MLIVENSVNCGEAYVLIATAIAGDEMLIKQFIVVSSCSLRAC